MTSKKKLPRRLKKRHWFAITIAVLTLITVITVFHPDFQKKMVLKYVTPSLDYLRIERLHVLPWSVAIDGLEVGQFGGHFGATTTRLRFCLSSLIKRTIDVKELTVAGAHADIRTFSPPPAPSTGPFPGVFPSLDHGLGIALSQAALDVSATLSDDQKVSVTISGDDVKPNAIGQLKFEARAALAEQQSVDLSGTVNIDQLQHGKFNAIEIDLDSAANLSALPETERTTVQLLLTPTVNPPKRKVEPAEGEIYFEPLPDAIKIALVQQDAEKNARASVDIDGIYDGLKGLASGTYKFTSNEKLATPYVKDLTLPSFEQAASGEFNLDIVKLVGEVLLTSETNITHLERVLGIDPKVPTKFSLLQDIALSFTSEQLTIDKMGTHIQDENQQTIMNSEIPQPFALEFANPAAALVQANTLLTLDIAGILLAWFNALLPEYDIVSGALDADFEIVTDAEGNLALAPGETVLIDDIRIDKGGVALIESLKVELRPRIENSPEKIVVDIKDFVISIGGAVVASANVEITAPKGAEEAPPVHATIAGVVNLAPLITQPAIREQLADTPIPNALSMHFDSALVHQAGVITVEQLKANVSQPGKEKLIDVKALQAFSIQTTDTGQQISNPPGDLAKISLNNIDLAWANPFAKPYEFAGELTNAQFTLRTAESKKLILASESPVKISRLNVRDNKTAVLKNVWLSVRPTIEYSAEASRINYEQLRISGGKRRMVAGNGTVNLKTIESQAPSVDADGRLDITLNNLLTQPVIAAALADRKFDTPLATNFSYRVSHSPKGTRIKALDLKLVSNKKTYVGLKTTSGITVKPVLKPGENLARHAVGEIALSIDNLTAEVLADFLPKDTLAFDTINGNLRLKSDGTVLSARAEQPLAIANVRLTDADGNAILHPFDFKAAANLKAAGKTITARLENLTLAFRGKGGAALSGTLSATVEPDRTIPLRELLAELSGDLPQLLNQPVILPNHGLTSGKLVTSVNVEPSGDIKANTKIDGLASAEPLAVHTIEMPLAGNMRPDGQGFDFKMPLIGTGISGTSDALTVGEYLPVQDEPALLKLRTTSELFYLNDILATIDGIKASDAKKKTDDSQQETESDAPVKIDDTPDAKAFWSALPYSTRVDFAFKQVFYSDYVAFHDIEGQIDLRNEKLAINNFAAYFHDSPITVDGGLTFDEAKSEPYKANLVANVTDFDLNQFFSELEPTKASRIEGLFGVDINVGGESPNSQQFRNRLLLDLHMTSRDGVFRPLPPDSPLAIGASDALGIIGEGLSYVPTGGFGAGAISRLVNYIQEIEYDSVDVLIKRDSSLDLQIERFDMLSKNIRMAATGTIEHVYGKDITNSPLDVVANLNMVGKGAAILYSMDLLDDEQDEFGYWKGPEFKIGGSVAATESNLAEIIERAGDGTVKGGITRPISGIIGNIKHRWFGGEANLDAAKTQSGEANVAPAPSE